MCEIWEYLAKIVVSPVKNIYDILIINGYTTLHVPGI